MAQQCGPAPKGRGRSRAAQDGVGEELPIPKRSYRAVVHAGTKRLLNRPGIAHLLLAADRFRLRLGFQFAASITYSSFLAVVPSIMVLFSVAGFVLESRPQLLLRLQDAITREVPGGLSDVIGTALDQAVQARLSIGVIGLLIALYSGVSWMGNLRSAIQAQWRPDFDRDQEIAAESIPRYYWRNLGYLITLGFGLLVSLALTTVGYAANGLILDWLGADEIDWISSALTAGPILLAVAVDVVIFRWVYTALSPRAGRAAPKVLRRGAVISAVSFGVLKFGFTYVLPTLLTTTTAKVFGPIIGLLFFFDFVAIVVLFVAAWIATAALPSDVG